MSDEIMKLKDKSHFLISEMIDIRDITDRYSIKKISPFVGFSNVEMIERRVDFPLPLSPVMTVNAFVLMIKLISCNMVSFV
jgi:hypothetical protein